MPSNKLRKLFLWDVNAWEFEIDQWGWLRNIILTRRVKNRTNKKNEEVSFWNFSKYVILIYGDVFYFSSISQSYMAILPKFAKQPSILPPRFTIISILFYSSKFNALTKLSIEDIKPCLMPFPLINLSIFLLLGKMMALFFYRAYKMGPKYLIME